MRVIMLTTMLLMVSVLSAQPLDRSRPSTEQIPRIETRPTPSEGEVLQTLMQISMRPQTSPDRQNAIDEEFYDDLMVIAQFAVQHNSPTIASALAAFPASANGAIKAKCHALRFFKQPIDEAVPFLTESLDNSDEDIRKEAAEVLTIWGRKWDKAIQVIYSTNDYLILAESKDPRAPDACRFGVQNGSFEGRILASYALQAFGDSTSLIEASRYVLRSAPVDDNDNSVARAKYTAIRTLAKHQDFGQIADLARLASDTAALVRMESVNAIAYAASLGLVAAYDALEGVAKNSTDPKLRGTARLLLQRLGETAKPGGQK